MLAAAAMLMVTMRACQSLGLFIFPRNTSTGLGIVTISFAMAVGQFVWGAVAFVNHHQDAARSLRESGSVCVTLAPQ